MHEMTLAIQAIKSVVEFAEENGIEEIDTVVLEIGELSLVVPEYMEEAWKAITINPAVITGISDRVGSLEVGKDADVAIFRGNPITDLQYTVAYTIIDGQIVHKG